MERDPRASVSRRSRPAKTFVRLGRLGGAHGLKGALRFHPYDPKSGSIKALPRVFVDAGGTVTEYRVLGYSRLNRGSARLLLEGIGDATRAEALKGGVVMAAEEDLPPLAAHEFYYYQVLGCDVALADGRVIGKIEDVFFTGANDVWVVRDGSKETLVPVIADVVKALDLAQRRVTIDAVPGLLE